MNPRAPKIVNNLGILHQGKARIEIGPLPVSYLEEDAPPEEAINANITSFTLPGLDLSYKAVHGYKHMVYMPDAEDNGFEGKTFSVKMLGDQVLENWYAIHRYMQTIKSYDEQGYPIRDLQDRVFGHDRLYRNNLMYVPYVFIHLGDDSMQKHTIVHFDRCWIKTLGDIDINFQSNSPIGFNLTFLYELIHVKRMKKPQPFTIPECVAS
jgi:hypothetical protein